MPDFAGGLIRNFNLNFHWITRANCNGDRLELQLTTAGAAFCSRRLGIRARPGLSAWVIDSNLESDG